MYRILSYCKREYPKQQVSSLIKLFAYYTVSFHNNPFHKNCQKIKNILRNMFRVKVSNLMRIWTRRIFHPPLRIKMFLNETNIQRYFSLWDFVFFDTESHTLRVCCSRKWALFRIVSSQIKVKSPTYLGWF